MTDLNCTHLPAGAGHPLRGVLIALALPAFALALLTSISEQTSPAPASPAPVSCPAQVAGELGIAYSVEDGATERLDSFHAGLIYCEMMRGQWICWDEENDYMPTGLERICGTPTQLNDTLAAGIRIWWTDLSAPIRDAGCQEDMPCWDCNRMGNRICGADLILPASPTLPSAPRPLAL